jgi:hypothetical protein
VWPELGEIFNSVPAAGSIETPLGGYALGNPSAALENFRYEITLYINNERAILSYLGPGTYRLSEASQN